MVHLFYEACTLALYIYIRTIVSVSIHNLLYIILLKEINVRLVYIFTQIYRIKITVSSKLTAKKIIKH